MTLAQSRRWLGWLSAGQSATKCHLVTLPCSTKWRMHSTHLLTSFSQSLVSFSNSLMRRCAFLKSMVAWKRSKTPWEVEASLYLPVMWATRIRHSDSMGVGWGEIRGIRPPPPPRRPKVHNLEPNPVEWSFECYFAAFIKKNYRNFLAPTAQIWTFKVQKSRENRSIF